ncbi:MAG: Purine nucleoside phosphorylase [Brockia lithotrophica]|uniref:Purine nucleoside phosphorylase DeoD-type n=1 Tax=Brockia lithotrophica TaxID=933949 RepID=A0A2T5GB32_9BACL|nr:MAG: Purine nucleoside phosphorylase [Brockia lithotrophica]
MSLHIGARKEDVASKVLLPGDPLRARFIAREFLEGAVEVNAVRGMYGYTGTYRGERVTVQGTGMGMPSMAIYATELLREYEVRTLIRVGTCGAFLPEVRLRDVVLAQGASTDSNMNRLHFRGIDYAPLADFSLLCAAYRVARRLELPVHVGGVFTTDRFYGDADKEAYEKKLAEHGTLCVEMETAALYTLAKAYGARALSILTVSDHLVTREETTAEERERTFTAMIQLALETLVADVEEG